ncbi:unnamed protein product, partial [Rotaria sp. Silwood1]
MVVLEGNELGGQTLAHSSTPLSSVPVQFIVKVIAAPSCSHRPELIVLAESCTPIKVNHT